MSEITQNFVVEPNNINITVDNNNINFTPTDIQLGIYTSAPGVAGGSNTQLQFNNNSQFGGIPNVTWNGSKLSLGNVANVRITGGTNGYVLQTDGTGNLSWTAQTGNGGGGNGTPGGANTQIQYNDSGNFGGNAGFTFNEVDGNVNMPTDLIVVGNIFGNVQTANYSNFAGAAFNVTGSNVTGAVTYATTANSVAGANVSGQVANSLVAGTVYTNAQPNITSVGTLANLTVTGNATFNSPIFIESGSERFTANTGTPSGTVVLDISNSSTLYAVTNNANANITLNITNISTASVANSSVVATYIYTNGANAYSINNLELDGTAYSIKWAGATPPTAYASSTMVYTFTILYIGGVGYGIIGTGTRYA